MSNLKIKIKESSKKVKIGFNGRSLPLGERPDIDKLALIALESNDKSLLAHFEEIPSLEELKKSKVANQLPTVPAAAATGQDKK